MSTSSSFQFGFATAQAPFYASALGSTPFVFSQTTPPKLVRTDAPAEPPAPKKVCTTKPVAKPFSFNTSAEPAAKKLHVNPPSTQPAPRQLTEAERAQYTRCFENYYAKRTQEEKKKKEVERREKQEQRIRTMIWNFNYSTPTTECTLCTNVMSRDNYCIDGDINFLRCNEH